MFVKVFLLLLLSGTLSSCATMVSGTTQKMSFQSNPDDVIITLISTKQIPIQDGKKTTWRTEEQLRILGKTPFTVQLDKAEGQSVTFTKEGYRPIAMELTTGTDPNFWGNILIGGAIGSTTDSMSGAIHQYEQSQFFVTLNPETATAMDRTILGTPREKAREFIVRRYTSLMADLSKGRGEDLSALLRMMQIDAAHEPDARRKILALSEVYPDAAVLATHVTDLYLNK